MNVTRNPHSPQGVIFISDANVILVQLHHLESTPSVVAGVEVDGVVGRDSGASRLEGIEFQECHHQRQRFPQIVLTFGAQADSIMRVRAKRTVFERPYVFDAISAHQGSSGLV